MFHIRGWYGVVSLLFFHVSHIPEIQRGGNKKIKKQKQNNRGVYE